MISGFPAVIIKIFKLAHIPNISWYTKKEEEERQVPWSANTAASHSLPLLRANRDSHVVARANEGRLYSQATSALACLSLASY